ncbi:MAG: ABC transporter permease [Bacteroides sp.]|nr:ABC transporter permease [Bacteroides sp.]
MIALRIAIRYLFSKKSHNAVNVISIVAILGVAVATAAIICVLSVFNGFADLAESRLSNYDPQLRVTPASGKVIDRADSLAEVIATEIPGVSAALPTISENAVAIFDGAQMAVNMLGVPAGYDAVTGLPDAIIDGQYATAETDMPVATVSVGTAMRLRAFPGTDRLMSVYVPKRTGRINTANPMASFRADSLFVGGVVRFEDSKRDAGSLMVPLDIARNLLEYDHGEATSIELAVSPSASVDQVAETLRSRLGTDYIVADRLQQEAESFRMIKVEKWITFVMLAFILIIASFNVISTLSMLIIEKRDNMRTLRALGATQRTIRRIFMWEGWLICVFGGLLGTVAGVALTLAQQYGKFVKLSGDPTQLAIEAYPMRLDPTDIALVMSLIILIGLAVGTITSRFGLRAENRV